MLRSHSRCGPCTCTWHAREHAAYEMAHQPQRCCLNWNWNFKHSASPQCCRVDDISAAQVFLCAGVQCSGGRAGYHLSGHTMDSSLARPDACRPGQGVPGDRQPACWCALSSAAVCAIHVEPREHSSWPGLALPASMLYWEASLEMRIGHCAMRWHLQNKCQQVCWSHA